VVDFKNTVIILTSNIGAHELLDGVSKIGEISEEVRETVIGLVKKRFRPEFINRWNSPSSPLSSSLFPSLSSSLSSSPLPLLSLPYISAFPCPSSLGLPSAHKDPRLDEMVIFKPLAKPELRKIIDIQLKLLEGYVEDKNIRHVFYFFSWRAGE
jgi:hypothetical protein